MLKKKLLIFSTSLAVLVAGGFLFQEFKPMTYASTEASTYQFKDVEDLEDRADLIVYGEVTKDFNENEPTLIYQEDNGRLEQFYTKVDFKVNKVLKGDKKIDNVIVDEHAAIIDEGIQKVLLVHDNYAPMEVGKTYLLFLKKNDFDEGYWTMSINQGKFNMDKQDKKENEYAEENRHYKKLKDEVTDKYAKKLK